MALNDAAMAGDRLYDKAEIGCLSIRGSTAPPPYFKVFHPKTLQNGNVEVYLSRKSIQLR